MTRNQENFEALFADAVARLKEYYPALNDSVVVDQIKEGARKDYDSSGNNQDDYEWLRNVIECEVPETNESSGMRHIKRFLRMAPMFIRGKLSWDNFKDSLRLEKKCVCLVGGGMMFCDREDEKVFFQEP